MNLFPAIDLYNGCAVRLYKGDYQQMTVYSEDPVSIARAFQDKGAGYVHLVDLEGARDGTTPNLHIVEQIAGETALFTEIGGGIRNMEIAQRYVSSGVDRIILGTAAVHDRDFLRAALKRFGEKVAVGIDIRDGQVATHGWTRSSGIDAFDFCQELQELGVKTVICTDISKDGAMQGTNRTLYRKLQERFPLNITASGGVSSLEDIAALRDMGLYGAILGKAYYTGAVSLEQALEAAR